MDDPMMPGWLAFTILIGAFCWTCEWIAEKQREREERVDSSWRWSNLRAGIVSDEFPGPR